MSFDRYILTVLEEQSKEVVQFVVAVMVSVVSKEDRRRGFGHADAVLVRGLLLELVLVILVPCEPSNRAIAPPQDSTAGTTVTLLLSLKFTITFIYFSGG